MSKAEVTDIDFHELSKLIERVEQAIEYDLALSVDDMKLLLCAITTLCTLQSTMEQHHITVHKLRKLLGMVQQSEKRQASNRKPRGSEPKTNKQRTQKKSNRLAKTKTVHHVLPDNQRSSVCCECPAISA